MTTAGILTNLFVLLFCGVVFYLDLRRKRREITPKKDG